MMNWAALGFASCELRADLALQMQMAAGLVLSRRCVRARRRVTQLAQLACQRTTSAAGAQFIKIANRRRICAASRSAAKISAGSCQPPSRQR